MERTESYLGKYANLSNNVTYRPGTMEFQYHLWVSMIYNYHLIDSPEILSTNEKEVSIHI